MFQRISAEQAKQLMDQGNTLVVDVRDPQSFAAKHIEHSINLNNDNLADFVNASDKEAPVLVCCYHGNSSQGAADFLNTEHHFLNTYSIDGGIEAWSASFATASS